MPSRSKLYKSPAFVVKSGVLPSFVLLSNSLRMPTSRSSYPSFSRRASISFNEITSFISDLHYLGALAPVFTFLLAPNPKAPACPGQVWAYQTVSGRQESIRIARGTSFRTPFPGVYPMNGR